MFKKLSKIRTILFQKKVKDFSLDILRSIIEIINLTLVNIATYRYLFVPQLTHSCFMLISCPPFSPLPFTCFPSFWMI